MITYTEFFATFISALVAGLATFGIILLARRVLPSMGERVAKLARYERGLDFSVYGLAIAYGVLLAAIHISKFDHMRFDPNDFGLFNQVLWNSLHGRLFENTFFYDAPVLLGQRFSPILVALLPLYAPFPSPHVLDILPPMAITLGVLPLYLFARERLGRPLAFVIILTYFLSPGIQATALEHFYEIKIALPLLMFATFFLLKRRYIPFLVCLGVALLCKEEVGFIVAGFGLYLVVFQRKVSFGILLTLFSILWTGLLLFAVIPYFQGGNAYYYIGGSGHSQYYGYLGTTIAEVATTILTRPDIVVQHLLIPDKISAVLWLLFPLGLLPLAGIEVAALAIPALGYTLLSDLNWMYLFGSHHYAPALAFIFMALVLGAERTVHWLCRTLLLRPLGALQNLATARAIVGGFLLGASVVAFLLSYDLPTNGHLARDWSLLTDPVQSRDLLAQGMAREIPHNAAVLVQEDLTALVSGRRDVYRIGAIPCNGLADYLFLDQRRPWYGYRKAISDDLVSRPDYQTVVAKDGYILKKRAPMQYPFDVQVDNGRLAFLGLTLPLTGTVQGNQTIRPILALRPSRQLPASYTLQVQLTDAKGHLWAQNDETFCGMNFPFDQWRPGMLIVEPVALHLPPTMPSGLYTLSLILLDQQTNTTIAVCGVSGCMPGDTVDLLVLPVQKNQGSFTASELLERYQLDNPYFVDMGEIRLIGFKSIPQRVTVGEALQVGIYWRAREKPRGDYLVVVQLRDPDGRVAFEQASRPANGTYSTTQWDAGEVLLDWHDLALPTMLAPGVYSLHVVLNDPNGAVLGETSLVTVSVVNP